MIIHDIMMYTIVFISRIIILIIYIIGINIVTVAVSFRRRGVL